MTHQRKLRIATSSYHVGHATAPTVALEKGFFKEEGLENFELLLEGLIPPFVEKQALFAAMKQRGVDIVLGAKASAVILLNSRGADLYIVSGLSPKGGVVCAAGDQGLRRSRREEDRRA